MITHVHVRLDLGAAAQCSALCEVNRKPKSRSSNLRELKNQPEESFRKLATSKGWRVTKRGWPDFLCINDKTKEIIAVEVKPRVNKSRLQYLKSEQTQTLTALSKLGMRCFVSDGITLEKFNPIKHSNGKWKADK